MQSRRRVQHHHVDSILVHGRDLILGALWLGAQLAALPTRLQELPHTRHRLAHVPVRIDHFIVGHVSLLLHYISFADRFTNCFNFSLLTSMPRPGWLGRETFPRVTWS